MRDLDMLYFKKYAIDPDSELNGSDLCIEAWLSSPGNESTDYNSLDEYDWMDTA